MDPQLLAGVVGVVGVGVGAAAVLAFRLSEHEQSAPVPTSDTGSALPSGLADVLAVLRSSAVVLDETDEVVRASPAAYALGVVRGGRVLADELLDMVRKVRRDGEIREAELELPRGPLGDRMMSVWARVAPLSSTLVLLLVEDRTEARQVDAVRRDFVANISHELKTPVGGLALLAEALLDAADDPEAVRRFAGRMQRESDRLTRLVQDIIELSRLQSHDPLERPTLVPLDDVVVEAVDRSRLTAETRSITLVRGGQKGMMVLGDSRQLVTALGNLVENAVRYGPEGSRVAVVVGKVEDGHGGPIAEVSVTDEGPGIAAGERERIFERFYRVDSARSRATGGTGLGLSIVKHVAAGHGGEATVWSDEGTGSTFTLRLPAATPSQNGGGPTSHPIPREETA
ncbi:MAG: two-component system, OmpR family, sensor histidine kinase SenX3 [Actinomycetota bacterium]|nr:two-component system, OmpR family, sensor histidine kinase SenX3 [Actinomycetota bacterium]